MNITFIRTYFSNLILTYYIRGWPSHSFQIHQLISKQPINKPSDNHHNWDFLEHWIWGRLLRAGESSSCGGQDSRLGDWRREVVTIRKVLETYWEWSFVWTPREGNYAAHNLAHSYINQNVSGVIPFRFLTYWCKGLWFCCSVEHA